MTLFFRGRSGSVHMKISREFGAGGGLILRFEMIASETLHRSQVPSIFRPRAYMRLSIRQKHASPLVGERYEKFWCDVADRALQIAFPQQLTRVDERVWIIGRRSSGDAVKLTEGLAVFERIFWIALIGVDPSDAWSGVNRSVVPASVAPNAKRLGAE
ncbi:MAG: hypothetical protein KGP27_11385 [Hyphomicrobiales bacterium]|nr:hypothetical protein [Hyphomicrobiales bacterium]